MISVEEALNKVLAETPGPVRQSVGLSEASGRYAIDAVAAPFDAPPFDNSAMDGFCVICADLDRAGPKNPVSLRLTGEVIAGDGSERALAAGQTLRINTGAPVPEGCEAVVRIEDVEVDEESVTFRSGVKAGEAIRRAGEDFRSGQTILEAGRQLDPRAVGVIASLGMDRVAVARRPRVALIASGDELVEPGAPLERGQIYNSSRYALAPLLGSFGAEVHDLGCVGDTRVATREALGRCFGFDALITTGGVSMGSHDFIRPTLVELGAREVFWKVKERPGMPIFFARAEKTLCFGLPGNPVSVFVTALLYVRAALLKMQGMRQVELPWSGAIAGSAFRKKAGLTTFMRAVEEGNDESGLPRVVPSSAQGSHQFSGLAASAGLVKLGEESTGAEAGERVDYLAFERLF